MLDLGMYLVRFPEDTNRWLNAGLMLVHCLRRWPNIKSILGHRMLYVVGCCNTTINRLQCITGVTLSRLCGCNGCLTSSLLAPVGITLVIVPRLPLRNVNINTVLRVHIYELAC